MAVEELEIIRLKNDFYKDGFYKVLIAFGLILLAILASISVSLYLFFSKPKPVVFSVDSEWRVLPPVPVDQPYVRTPDLLQWVSEVLSSAFTYDFVHYQDQLKNQARYFTDNGWKAYLGHLNEYANATTIQNSTLFISSSAGGAPFIVNQGLLQGRYSWWVQMPINLSYSGGSLQPLTIQVLVVRVPTLNNLSGMAIDNMIITRNGRSEARANG
jgi:intracellular multiplication protein IcmL